MPVTFTERPIGSVEVTTSGTKKLDIPRDNTIRRIIMRFIINLTTGATAPTYKEDEIQQFIKKIRLVKNGDKNIFNVSGRMWWFVEKFEKGTKPYKVDPTSATSTTADAILTLIADFALDRKNENDIRALLQPQDFSSLKLEIDYGSNADIASANAPTINTASSSVQVEIREVLGTVKVGEQEVDINSAPMQEISELEETIDLIASKTSFDTNSLPYNISPAPATHMTHTMLVLDNGVRSDSLVTDVKYQKEKGGRFPILERKYTGLREETKTEYAQETLDTGVVYVDHIDKLDGGLVHTGNEGDIKIRFLTSSGVTAGQDTVLLFVRSKSLV